MNLHGLTPLANQESDMFMKISLDHARKHFADLIRRVSSGDETIVLTRRNKPVAALVSMEDLELLQTLEDQADIEDARKARNEPGPNICWENFRKTLDS